MIPVTENRRSSHMRATTAVVTLVALFIAGSAASHGAAQEPPGVLPALLTEVRGLRAAMEQMASAGPRVQLALGRLQLQEQRVSTLVRRLETVRDNLAAAQRQYAQHQNQLAQFDGAAKSNPAEREDVEHMLTLFKGEMSAAAASVQRLTAEESSLAADIATEQGRWEEFNGRLEELERTLERR
jgi:chromosome segregation ATPase